MSTTKRLPFAIRIAVCHKSTSTPYTQSQTDLVLRRPLQFLNHISSHLRSLRFEPQSQLLAYCLEDRRGGRIRVRLIREGQLKVKRTLLTGFIDQRPVQKVADRLGDEFHRVPFNLQGPFAVAATGERPS